MKRLVFFAVLMVVAFMTIAGLHLTFHSGEVDAVVQGDSNFRNRYVGLVSTTPITDINQLNGVSSNVQTQLDAAGTGTLVDGKVFVGNGSNVATGVTPSGDITWSNAGVTTIGADKIESSNIAIANVQASDIFTNTVTLNIAAGTTTNSVAVEAGSVLMSVFPRTGFSNLYTITNAVYVSNSLTVDTDAHPVDMTVDALFMRP